MTDTSATTQPPATPAPVAPVTPPSAATPTAPASAPSHEDMVYKDQAAVDRAIGQRLEQERTKLATAHAAELAKARDEAKAEVTKSFLSKLVDTSAESIARELKFHDPKDALAAIDRAKLPVKDDAPDGDAIKAAIEKLVKDKPYLVAADDEKRRPSTTKRPALPDGNPDPKGEGKKSNATEALRKFAGHR